MADMEQIRAGITANLKTIGANQTSPYFLANPTPPSLFVVGQDETLYDTSFGRGGDEITLVIRGLVGGAHDVGSQKRLDRWLDTSGAESVKEAVEQADDEGRVTLGGVIDDLRVTRSTRPTVFTFAGVGEFLGAEWFVQVETSG